MRKIIYLANITVKELVKGKPIERTYFNRSHVDGATKYKNMDIVRVEKIEELGKTNY